MVQVKCHILKKITEIYIAELQPKAKRAKETTCILKEIVEKCYAGI